MLWRCKRGIQEDATNHKVSLQRIRDRATVKKPVVRETQTEPQPRSKCENPRQNHSQRVSGEKNNEVKQHGYEDSEKYIEATMRSQSSAQSSRRGDDEKNRE